MIEAILERKLSPEASAEEWLDIYQRAWHLYYSPEHVETLMRRAQATGLKANRLLSSIMLYYGSYRFEGLHPLQCGLVRRRRLRFRRQVAGHRRVGGLRGERIGRVFNVVIHAILFTRCTRQTALLGFGHKGRAIYMLGPLTLSATPKSPTPQTENATRCRIRTAPR